MLCEPDRNAPFPGHRTRVETELGKIDDAVAGYHDGDGKAQLLQRERKRAYHVSQSTGLSVWDALTSNDDDVKARHFVERAFQSYPFTSSFARWVARTTAFINVTRNPPSSNSSIPSIVQPAGVVTMSFSLAGCSPVSKTMLEAPSTI